MTKTADLKAEIEAAWETRDALGPSTKGRVREAVEATLALLDAGELRAAEKVEGRWETRAWAKQAILLSFRLNPNRTMSSGGGVGPWWDKVPSKFEGWDAAAFEAAGFRAVPGSIVRRGAYVAPGVVLMPSFVNIGAYV
ncbi:MAG: 2,3,4,5-tetrahydropyridine-2,6-dicarboxylate N-succinyltransferase, partial [Caulobacteraceae bacterium]